MTLAQIVAKKQAKLGPNEDPWGFPEAQELLRQERAENHRRLSKLHPGNRFRLMFGQSTLPENHQDQTP